MFNWTEIKQFVPEEWRTHYSRWYRLLASILIN